MASKLKHFPDCGCKHCARDLDPMEEVVEAATALWYAWETRSLAHPDHPPTVRIWNQRMTTAGTRLREALVRAEVIDDRIARSQSSESRPR